MASTVGVIIQEALSGQSRVNHSVALSFQYQVLSTLFGCFCLLSSFPIVSKDYIQCLCDPLNIWKDTVEIACLTGDIRSNFTYLGTTTEIYHPQYHLMPFSFLWLMVISTIPSGIWMALNSNIYSNLVKGLKSFNPAEYNSRCTRLQLFLSNELSYISRHYLFVLFIDAISLFVYVYQVAFCDSIVHNMFYFLLQWILGGEQSYIDLFPKKVSCLLSKKAPDGNEDIEEFLCILTMSVMYQHFFEILFIVLAFSGILHVISTASHILVLFPNYRR